MSVAHLNSWLRRHGDYAAKLLSLVVPCLSMPELAGNAAAALKDLTAEGAAQVLPLLGPLLESTAGGMMSLHPGQRATVIESLAAVVMYLPYDSARQVLLQLLQPILSRLQSILCEQNGTVLSCLPL
jgi:hypothetical protein